MAIFNSKLLVYQKVIGWDDEHIFGINTNHQAGFSAVNSVSHNSS